MEDRYVLHSEDQQIIHISNIKLFCECKIQVPEFYDHINQLGSLDKKKIYRIDKLLSDKNFSKVTNRLEVGKEYLVQIFQLKKNASSKACLNFLKSQKSYILVGAQGLTLLWQLNKKMFPIGKGVVSFDNKHSLCKDKCGSYRVPNMVRIDINKWMLVLGRYELPWGLDSCILSFCTL